jgi:hypothetical protein
MKDSTSSAGYSDSVDKLPVVFHPDILSILDSLLTEPQPRTLNISLHHWLFVRSRSIELARDRITMTQLDKRHLRAFDTALAFGKSLSSYPVCTGRTQNPQLVISNHNFCQLSWIGNALTVHVEFSSFRLSDAIRTYGHRQADIDFQHRHLPLAHSLRH